MRLPNQSRPVARSASVRSVHDGIAASGIACTICNLGCAALPEPAKTLCLLACSKTVC